MNDESQTLHEQDLEIRLLRRLVQELYHPACAELGPACEDIVKGYENVLARALNHIEYIPVEGGDGGVCGAGNGG